MLRKCGIGFDAPMHGSSKLLSQVSLLQFEFWGGKVCDEKGLGCITGCPAKHVPLVNFSACKSLRIKKLYSAMVPSPCKLSNCPLF